MDFSKTLACNTHMGLISRQAGVDLETRVQAWVNQLYDDLGFRTKTGLFEIDKNKTIKIKTLPRTILRELLERNEDIPDYILIDFGRFVALDLSFDDPTYDIDWMSSKIDKINSNIKNLRRIKIRVNHYRDEYMFTISKGKWTFRKL